MSPAREPGPQDGAHRHYWRFHLRLMATLLTLAVLVSALIPLFGRRLAHVMFGNWPLPFYMGGQGALLVYLALLLAYVMGMRHAERQLYGDAVASAADVTGDSPVADNFIEPPSIAHTDRALTDRNGGDGDPDRDHDMGRDDGRPRQRGP